MRLGGASFVSRDESLAPSISINGDEARDLFVLDLAHRLNDVKGERS
jgi:hypothetical protein